MPPGFFQIRVFLSGPSDVETQKGLVKDACDEMNQMIRDEFKVSLLYLDYKDSVASQLGPPIQDLIDERIGDYEVYIGILRKRFGTPPGGTHPDTGLEYGSGTEREFEQAYAQWKRSKEPIITFYFDKNPSLNPSPRAEEVDQLGKVIRFRDKIKNERHEWIVEFDDNRDFEKKVRAFLYQVCKDISKRLTEKPRSTQSVIQKLSYQNVKGYLQRATVPLEEADKIGSSYHWHYKPTNTLEIITQQSRVALLAGC